MNKAKLDKWQCYNLFQARYGEGGKPEPTGIVDIAVGRTPREAAINYVKQNVGKLHGSAISQDDTILYGADGFYYTIEEIK